MSFSSDVVEVSTEGDVIARFFESELHYYQELYDTFKDYFTITPDRAYHTGDIIDEISKNHTIRMTDYYISENGYNVWVDGKDEPINIPLDQIPLTEDNTYTLRGVTKFGMYDEPSRYKSWIYKLGKSYIINSNDWQKAISYFPKKHNIRNFIDKNYIIVNSY